MYWDRILAPNIFWGFFWWRILFKYFCPLKKVWKWESCLKTVKAESPGATILRNNGTHTVHWGLTSFMSENISIGQIGRTNNCSRGKCFWDWNQKCSPQTEVKAASFKKQSNDYRPGRHPLASINQWLRSIKCNCSPEWPTNFFNGTFGHHKLLKERTQVAILCNQSQLARQGALPGGGGWPGDRRRHKLQENAAITGSRCKPAL